MIKFKIRIEDNPKIYVIFIGLFFSAINFFQSDTLLTALNSKINQLINEKSLNSMQVINEAQFKMNMYIAMEELLKNAPDSNEKGIALSHIARSKKYVYPSNSEIISSLIDTLNTQSLLVKFANILLQISTGILGYYAAAEQKKYWFNLGIVIGSIGCFPMLLYIYCKYMSIIN